MNARTVCSSGNLMFIFMACPYSRFIYILCRHNITQAALSNFSITRISVEQSVSHLSDVVFMGFYNIRHGQILGWP